MADSTLWYGQQQTAVDIALKNGGGIRDTILGPQITRLTIGAALAFDNKLAIVELQGDELLATMENAVSRVPHLDGRFPQIAGLLLEYDASKPGMADELRLMQASRVRTLIVTRADGSRDTLVENFEVQGDVTRTFTVATNDFLLTGGDGYQALKAAAEARGTLTVSEIGERQILIEYIQNVLNSEVDLPEPLVTPRIVERTLELTQIAQFSTGVFDEGAAEIVTYDADTQSLFFINAHAASVTVLDISDPSNPTSVETIETSGAGVNSVAVNNGILAVAVQPEEAQAEGHVAFYDTTDFSLLNNVTVGALPDMVTFTPDGQQVLVANEGEPNEAYTIDPEGSVSIIDLSRGVSAAQVTTAQFSDFNTQKAELMAAGVRIFGPQATVAQDLEPEFITIAADSRTAWVALQENNALAVIDIPTATVTDILPLGFKDHSLADNALDASDEDGGINIRTWPVFGMYQPDAIANYQVGETTYLVTANEGDSRDYEGFREEARVAEVTLETEIFPNATELQQPEQLGRLKITRTLGDNDGDGDFDALYAYGGRSFSLWDTQGQLIFDSGSDFAHITATQLGEHFNDNDSRSDDKGAEPEALALGTLADRTYAFIGLERTGGIMVYDITNPQQPRFIRYINNRDFSKEPFENVADRDSAGDIAPESIIWIAAEHSPNHRPLLVVSHEVSGTVTIYQVE